MTTVDAAGLLVLCPDNSIALADAIAESWLAELGGEALPPVVAAVAGRARSVGLAIGQSAHARACTASGRWLLIRASVFAGGQTAVIIEPARPHDLAALVADECGLTERERAVTQLVALGLPTNTIAARLYLSPWTVQDHLKAIFDKVGVCTRGELVARVFFGQAEPGL